MAKACVLRLECLLVQTTDLPVGKISQQRLTRRISVSSHFVIQNNAISKVEDLYRMASRKTTKASEHDAVVRAIKRVYEREGIQAYINPGSQQEKSWGGYYIDVIAVESADERRAWVIEVETDDSISDGEARDQWKRYDDKYDHWFLAVPSASRDEAERLCTEYGISNCTVIAWVHNPGDKFYFRKLPGLK